MKKLATLIITAISLCSCVVTKQETQQQNGTQGNLVYKNFSSKYALHADYSYAKHQKAGTLSADSTNIINP